MDAKRKQSGYSGVMIGVALGLICIVVSAVLISFFLSNEKINEETAANMTYPALIISTAVCSTIAGRRAGEKIALRAAMATMIHTLLILAAAILCFNGLGANMLIGLLCILIGYVIACAICIMNGSRRKKRKRLVV